MRRGEGEGMEGRCRGESETSGYWDTGWRMMAVQVNRYKK